MTNTLSNADGPDEVTAVARAWNYDAYAAATLAPAAVQADLIAIAAFVGELERVRLTLAEPALAQIRIQWWRDALQNVADDYVIAHPVGAALSEVIQRHLLPIGLVVGIADAISDQIGGLHCPDDHALRLWLTKRYAAPFELAARCLKCAPDARHNDAGHAYGLAQLLAQGTTDEDLADAGIAETTERLRIQCQTTATSVMNTLKACPRTERLSALPVALVPLYLGKSDSRSSEPPSQLKILSRLAFAYWFGR